MRRGLVGLVLVALMVVPLAAFASGSGEKGAGSGGPAAVAGGVGFYTNLGAGWWGGTDWNNWLTANQAVVPSLVTTASFAWSAGIIDRIGGNPVYFEVVLGLAGFTGGWNTSTDAYSVTYFSMPTELNLGARIPVGKLFLLAQAGFSMKLHLFADYNRTGSLVASGSLSSIDDYSLLAFSIPLAAGVEIPINKSLSIDVLATYDLGLGLENYLFTTWQNLTESQAAVRVALVFPFPAARPSGSGSSQPSTGGGPVQR